MSRRRGNHPRGEGYNHLLDHDQVPVIDYSGLGAGQAPEVPRFGGSSGRSESDPAADAARQAEFRRVTPKPLGG